MWIQHDSGDSEIPCMKRLFRRRIRFLLRVIFLLCALSSPVLLWYFLPVRELVSFVFNKTAAESNQFVFAFFVTLLVGILVIAVAGGLVIQKMTYGPRMARKTKLEEWYGRKMDPILLEDLPEESLNPESEEFSSAIEVLCKPLRKELAHVNWFSRRAHRRALKHVMIEMSRELVGETRARLTLAFRYFGLIDSEIRDLKSDRWWIRANACRNVAQMQALEAGDALVELLDDREEDVRTEAAMALVGIARVRGLERILSNVKGISTWMSIQLSKAVLGMGAAAVPELIGALKTGCPSVRSFCVEMLGEIGDINACTPLISFARTASSNLLCKCLIAIGKLGDDSGRPILLEHLDDTNEEIRIHAANGLGFLAVPDTAAALKDHLIRDKIHVRLAAGRALMRIGERGQTALLEAYQSSDEIGKKVVLQYLEILGISENVLSTQTN
jgi:HEAT repeat protein